jgi:hypothetical protein
MKISLKSLYHTGAGLCKTAIFLTTRRAAGILEQKRGENPAGGLKFRGERHE